MLALDCYPSKLLLAVLVLTTLLSSIAATAQDKIVQFQTNVGDFNLTLNPTNNPNLQLYVDNLLAYVKSGRYDNTVINRAEDRNTVPPSEFVIQWGIFVADATRTGQLGVDGFTSIQEFDPVVVDGDGDGQVDFDTSGLSNTLGTVAFAISANLNSATSSIYVNLNDNSFLDAQGFVPFAVIEDLTIINSIANLPTVNLGSQIGEPYNLHFRDIPITGQDEFVIVQRATVVPEPASITCFFSSIFFYLLAVHIAAPRIRHN